MQNFPLLFCACVFGRVEQCFTLKQGSLFKKTQRLVMATEWIKILLGCVGLLCGCCAHLYASQTLSLPLRSFCDGGYYICQGACQEALDLSQQAVKDGLAKRRAKEKKQMASEMAKEQKSDDAALLSVLNQTVAACYQPCKEKCEKQHRQCLRNFGQGDQKSLTPVSLKS